MTRAETGEVRREEARTLTDIDLGRTGRFCEAPATFACSRYHLPEQWDYVYTNGEILLRIRHDGSGYLQADPPHGTPLLGGPPLLGREGGHDTPSMLVWIIPAEPGQRHAFTNFWMPAIPLPDPAAEPDEYRCTFSPEKACYQLRHRGWVVRTELWVPPQGAAVIMTVSLRNASRKRHSVTLMPAIRPHMGPFTLAPWDVAHWYQTAAFCRLGKACGVWLETRDPGGDPARRFRAAVVTNLAPDAYEVCRGEFVGTGQWAWPEAVWRGTLARGAADRRIPAYGNVTSVNGVVCRPPVAAMARKLALGPGQERAFTIVFGKLPGTADGALPPRSAVAALARRLSPRKRAGDLRRLRRHADELFRRRRLETPDDCLSRYVNEFLPLQARWISLLDRGWPSGYRGTRDAAQDATSVIPVDPAHARARLLEICANQRADGWFPRAYDSSGQSKRPSPGDHVDAGAWVWELLWEYVCHTRDFGVLDQRTDWLDDPTRSTILEHATALFAYYTARPNLGVHGLCKIRGGDWNDSVNLAGLGGRGESVMVSCQAVLGLEQAADLFDLLADRRGDKRLAATARRFARAASGLKDNLLKHARNRQGYFNGVWTDAGRWVFSPADPDGRTRVNGPANSFAIIAGIVGGLDREKVFRALDTLKGPHGWRLFHPPIGSPPIEKLGRIGQGDLAAGMGENGTCYNHGSHGFLGRAAWTAGKGDMLHEVMRHMLPYDQRAHPVAVARTAPYAMVNHWRELIGAEGAGGDTFLTGSIATALRNCYDGLLGFRPALEHVIIDPCIPAEWEHMAAEVPFLGGRWRIDVHNPDRVQCGVAELLLDGRRINCRLDQPRLGRSVAAIPVDGLRPGRDFVVSVRMGDNRHSEARARPANS